MIHHCIYAMQNLVQKVAYAGHCHNHSEQRVHGSYQEPKFQCGKPNALFAP